MIKRNDIVVSKINGLLFKCENGKHEKWMNLNHNYVKTPLKTIDYEEWERIIQQRRDKGLAFFINMFETENDNNVPLE